METLTFQLVSKDEFHAIGIELTGPYSELQQIGPLWQTFVSRIGEIPARINPDAMVSMGLTKDRPTDFTYYASVEVANVSEVPEGMVSLTVPAASYAVFTHKGSTDKLGDTINQARRTIKESGYGINHDAYWFELYDKRYNPTSENSEFDLYFPIAAKI